MTDTQYLTSYNERDKQLAKLTKRVERIEAALDEIAKGVSVYTNDKLYEERESKKE